MGPRKKAKRTHSSTPQAEAAQSAANTPGSSASVEKEEYDHLNDPWTDEQETALLKAIIKWKPVGMHKHFRMIAIADYLQSQGFGPSNGEHMQIPGIWKKLGTLYNLEALDERENPVYTGWNGEEDDEDGESDWYCPFELPYEEYGDLMFARRLAEDGSSSPISSVRGDSQNGSTAGDTDALSEPASSPAPSRSGRKSNNGTRKRATRSTKIQVEIENDGHEKGSDAGAGSDDDTGGNEDEEGEEGSDGEESEAEEAEEEKGWATQHQSVTV
ncbi:hypothetical protein N7470_009634 [Penicillium chermesinum]|nr:hypothetical protein N7470_009634 [Penicillium chermesinum]